MRAEPESAPRLRPFWHVGVPFLIGAGMLGIIALASQNRAALWLSLLLVAWGIVWSLLARRGAQRHMQAIAAATDLLAAPTLEHAIWLGPARLMVRPRKHGHLLWTTHGLTWTSAEVASLADPTRRVLLGAFRAELSLPFIDIIACHHAIKVLSGEQLILSLTGSETYRFGLSNPAIYSFVLRAFASQGPHDPTARGKPTPALNLHA